MRTILIILAEHLVKWILLFAWAVVCETIGFFCNVISYIVKGILMWAHICSSVITELFTMLVGYIQGFVTVDFTYWRYHQCLS